MGSDGPEEALESLKVFLFLLSYVSFCLITPDVQEGRRKLLFCCLFFLKQYFFLGVQQMIADVQAVKNATDASSFFLLQEIPPLLVKPKGLPYC
jgi:hypothetical protein